MTVAALTLAGCSLLPGAVLATVAGTTSAPKVGDCWNASLAHASAWANWEGESASACSGPHVLYTYTVGAISGVPAKSWAAPGSSSDLSDAVESKAAKVCAISALLPHLKWNQQLVQAYFFVPSEAQWRAGARWVRCDVGLLAFGAPLDNETFGLLPSHISTLISTVTSDPGRYEFCVNSPVPVTEAGPLDDPASTLADCRNNPEWMLDSHGLFPAAAGSTFPSAASATAETTKLCAPDASTADEVWAAYLPSKADWATGDREIDCWVGTKQTSDGQTV
jgi:hypothetical protein